MAAKKFKAVIELLDNRLGWTIVRVPFAPSDAWPKMLPHRVKGTVNDFAFRSSLSPLSRTLPDESVFYLMVNKAVQKGAGASLGQMVEVILEPDFEPRPAELPDELAELLDEEPGLREWYDELSESMRREICKWIVDVKSDEARRKRAGQMAERLLSAMEGEKELPPIIAVAFRRRPKAKAGWEKMTQVQRRQHLLGVFYYQSPEGREKRVAKLCDEAEEKVADT
jgi:hypothetical protein